MKISTSGTSGIAHWALYGGIRSSSYAKHRKNIREQECLPRLTAVHNAVWHLALQLKLSDVQACQPMVTLIMKLLYWRYFMLYTSDGQTSHPFRTWNGVARGSVIAHCL